VVDERHLASIPPRRERECSKGHSHDEVSITAMPERLE
jgi:hypothetical protein